MTGVMQPWAVRVRGVVQGVGFRPFGDRTGSRRFGQQRGGDVLIEVAGTEAARGH